VSREEAPKKKSRVSWVSWAALLAVIGIVVAIAVPSYGDYTHRSQASEAVTLLGGAKTPLAEYFADRNRWPGKLEEVVAETSGKFTRSVAITKAAGSEVELTATMKTEGVDRRAAGAKIRMFSSDGGRTWTCRGERDRQNILPSACRDPAS
jgi:type IV pilus assembly protein PilA